MAKARERKLSVPAKRNLKNVRKKHIKKGWVTVYLRKGRPRIRATDSARINLKRGGGEINKNQYHVDPEQFSSTIKKKKGKQDRDKRPGLYGVKTHNVKQEGDPPRKGLDRHEKLGGHYLVRECPRRNGGWGASAQDNP